MSDIDAVVVGSGIGGLSAALTLARSGRSVVVAEASDDVGGLMRPVERAGYSFDVGVHYLGKLGPGELFRQYLDGLGLRGLEFVELAPDGFDRYVFPGFEISFCKGRERFTERLIRAFPREADGIRGFFELVGKIDDALDPSELRHHGFLPALRYLRHHPVLLRYGRASFGRVLDHYVSDPRLRAVLCAPLFDVALSPSRVSAVAATAVWGYFLGGAYYPRGGSRGLRDAFVAALRACGAHIKKSSRVVLLGKRGSEWVARFDKGWTLAASVVVSAVDPRLTLGTLVSPELVPRRVRRKAERLRPSLAIFLANIGTDLDLPSLGITSANIAHFDTWDPEEYFDRWQSDRLPHVDGGFFLTSPSVKDPDGQLAPEGKHALQILGGASYDLFQPWAKTPVTERGDAYRDLVDTLGTQLVAKAEAYVPGLSDHLELVDFRSPLFIADRTSALRGGIYGPEHAPDQMGYGRFPSLECGIDGLYLAGAGTMGAGLMMSCASGVLAARLAEAHLSHPTATQSVDMVAPP